MTRDECWYEAQYLSLQYGWVMWERCPYAPQGTPAAARVVRLGARERAVRAAERCQGRLRTPVRVVHCVQSQTFALGLEDARLGEMDPRSGDHASEKSA